MKNLVSTIVCLFTLILLTPQARAQQAVAELVDDGISRPGVETNSAPLNSASARLDSLRKRRAALSRYLETVNPSSRDYDTTASAIRALDVQLFAFMAGTGQSSVRSASQPQLAPKFELATPGDKLTNESVQPTLSWTEDQNPPPLPTIEKFVVEIADEDDFSSIIHSAEVQPRPHPLSNMYTVPEGILEKGVTYHWRVTAFYKPTPTSPLSEERNAGSPFSFTTARSLFKRFSDRGFSLQRAVEGPDAGKGAEFSFLRTLGKNTVYTADFALIYDHRFTQTARTSVGFQTSVEGKLTSDDSESEDAWRFRAGAVIDRQLKPGTLNLMYLALNGKFEGDQDFDTKKMSFEALFTPTLPKLAIGVSTPLDTASPFQFRWRPFLGLSAGRTIRSGTSEETKDSIFRLTPRVTAKLKLNFLNEKLKLNEVYLWLDNTFNYLPLESKTKRNFFTSGLEFEVTDNLGFGVTYKNGESAPKFIRINTLGATISIRFNKSDQ